MRGAPIRPPGGKLHPFYRFACVVWRLFGRLYLRIEIEGLEHVPRKGGCLLMPNHLSFLDPPLVGAFFPVEMHFLARESLFEKPVLGRMLLWLNGHPIRREGIDRSAIKAGVEAVRAGYPLLIFPEGTRSADGRIKPPKGGFGMILEHFNEPVPCVPIIIRGTEKAMPKGALIPLPRKVRIKVGPAFQINPIQEGEGRRTYYDRCVTALTEAWISLGADEIRS